MMLLPDPTRPMTPHFLARLNPEADAVERGHFLVRVVELDVAKLDFAMKFMAAQEALGCRSFDGKLHDLVKRLQ